jgi:hypothetical protein
MMAKRNISAPVGNKTTIVHVVASNITDRTDPLTISGERKEIHFTKASF